MTMNREQKRRRFESAVSDIFDQEFYEKSGLMIGMSVDGVDSIESRYVHDKITLEEAIEQMEEIKSYYLG